MGWLIEVESLLVQELFITNYQMFNINIRTIESVIKWEWIGRLNGRNLVNERSKQNQMHEVNIAKSLKNIFHKGRKRLKRQTRGYRLIRRCTDRYIPIYNWFICYRLRICMVCLFIQLEISSFRRYTMASASADNIKQWKFPDGNFIQNLTGHNAILNCLAVNSDGVLVSGGNILLFVSLYNV